MDLREQFGDIDIYLFDQLLRGRIVKGMRVVDAGCGYGRNLVYLLRAGFEVHGVDLDPDAIQHLPRDRFHVASVEEMPFADGFADVVISNAVLHFASDDTQFEAMLRGMWRVIRRDGLLFCRLASTIGIEGQAVRLGGRRYWLPDGSERYLVDAELLDKWMRQLGGELVDPLKTTVVQGQRAMSTWVVRKR